MVALSTHPASGFHLRVTSGYIQPKASVRQDFSYKLSLAAYGRITNLTNREQPGPLWVQVLPASVRERGFCSPQTLVRGCLPRPYCTVPHEPAIHTTAFHLFSKLAHLCRALLSPSDPPGPSPVTVSFLPADFVRVAGGRSIVGNDRVRAYGCR